MSVRNTRNTYGSASRLLHGLLFLLISAMLIVGSLMGEIANDDLKGQIYGIHKVTGLIVLAVGIIFVFWSLINPKPAYPETMPCWEKLLARATHISLYFLVLAMPLSGWILSTAAGRAPQWFGTPLPMPLVPLSKPLKEFGADAHEVMAWILFALIVLHTLGALKHHFIDKNNLLARMFCPKCR